MELCPAIRARVQASQPDSPRRVRNVCRNEYRTNGRTGFALFCFASSDSVLKARACCYLRLEDSRWVLRVWAGQTHPSMGLPAFLQYLSRIDLTRGVIGRTRLAAAVFPCVTKNVPYLPLDHV